MIHRFKHRLMAGVSGCALLAGFSVDSAPATQALNWSPKTDLKVVAEPIGSFVAGDTQRWKVSVTNPTQEDKSAFNLVVQTTAENPAKISVDKQTPGTECTGNDVIDKQVVYDCSIKVLKSNTTSVFEVSYVENSLTEGWQRLTVDIYMQDPASPLPTNPSTIRSLVYPRTAPSTQRIIDRVGGADRYETSSLLSKKTFPEGRVQRVFLVSGQSYPDALAASSWANYMGSASVLLVQQKRIPATIAQELKRLQPASVHIVGGTGVLSKTIEQQVADILPNAKVNRYAGHDRFDTYSKMRNDETLYYYTGTRTSAYVVNGMDFPDALAASSAPAGPILMVQKDHVESDYITGLPFDANGRIVIVGGPGVISAEVEKYIRDTFASQKMEVVRIGGKDRFETAKLLAESEYGGARRAVVANAFDYPDALSGALLAGQNFSPILLTAKSELPPFTQSALKTVDPIAVTVAGGEGVVSEKVRKEVGAVTGLKLK